MSKALRSALLILGWVGCAVAWAAPEAKGDGRVAYEQQDGLIVVTTPRLRAVINVRSGATLEQLAWSGVELLPPPSVAKSAMIGQVRFLKPANAIYDEAWQVELERPGDEELDVVCTVRGVHESEVQKRFRFRADSPWIDVRLSVKRLMEGMVSERYSLWVHNLLGADSQAAGWTYWIPAHPSATLFPPAAPERSQSTSQWMYDPKIPAVGVLDAQGNGLFMLPDANHLDLLYCWWQNAQKGTVEWAYRNVEVNPQQTFQTEFRLLPLSLGAARPLGVLKRTMVGLEFKEKDLELVFFDGQKRDLALEVRGAAGREPGLTQLHKQILKLTDDAPARVKLTLAWTQGRLAIEADGERLELEVNIEQKTVQVLGTQPPPNRVGRSNNPDAQRADWRAEPQLNSAEGDRLIANFSDVFGALTKAGAIKPEITGTPRVEGKGRFGQALGLAAGDVLAYDGKDIIPTTRGSIQLWYRADGADAANWNHLVTYAKAVGDTNNALRLSLTPHGTLQAAVYDSKGGLHRAYRKFQSPKGEWVFVQMVWDTQRPVSGTQHVELYISGANLGNEYGVAGPFEFQPPADSRLRVGSGFAGAIDGLKINDLSTWQTVVPERMIDYTAVTPAFTWADKLPGKRIKALFVLNHFAAADVAHLARLLPLDPTVVKFVYSMKASGVYAYADDGSIQSHQSFLDRLEQALGQPYDVIVVSPLSWKTHLPVRVQELLAGQLRAGAGLVVLTPHDFADQPAAQFIPGRPAGDKDVEKSLQRSAWQRGRSGHFISNNVPFEVLLPTEYLLMTFAAGETPVRAKDNSPIVHAGTQGKARVVTACYNAATRLRNFSIYWTQGSLIPSNVIPRNEAAGVRTHCFEYYRLLLARSILWAAQRETRCDYILVPPAADAAGKAWPTLQLHWSEKTEVAATVELRVSTANGLWNHRWSQPVMLKPGDNNINISPDVPTPGGRLIQDVRIADAAGTICFGAHTVEAPAAGRLVSVELNKPGYDADEAGVLRVRLGSAVGQGTCRLTLRDRYERAGFISAVTVAGTQIEIPFKASNLAPPWFRATVELLRPDGTLLDIGCADGMLAPAADALEKYAQLTWGAFTNELTTVGGVASLGGGTGGALNYADSGASPIPYLWPDFNSKSMGIKGAVDMGGGRFRRDPALLDPAFQEKTRSVFGGRVAEWKLFKPLAYMLADEVRFSPAGLTYWEGCWDPSSLKAFTDWLRRGYPSLEALNKQWGTSFARWEDVQPSTLEQARSQVQGNLAAWMDFREFADVTWAGYLDQTRQIIRQHDPVGRNLLSGTVDAGPSNGYNWYKVLRSVDVLMPYWEGTQLELIRSLRPGSGSKVLPYRGSYGIHGPAFYAEVFTGLLNQFDGISTWTSQWFVNPEGSLSLSGREMKTVHDPFSEGLWDYVRSFERQTPVAVLHSMPSLRVNYVIGQSPDQYTRTLDGCGRWLHQMCVGWRMISPEQIDEGQLEKNAPRMVILPLSHALSQGQVEALLRYVRAGGTILMDKAAGLRDEHGTPRAGGLLQRVTAAAPARLRVANAEVLQYPVGKGRVLLHSLDLATMPNVLNGSDQALAGAWSKDLTKLLQSAQIAPFVTAHINGKPFRGQSAVYSLGDHTLVMLLPDAAEMETDQAPMTLTLPQVGFVHLPMTHQALGNLSQVETAVRPGWPVLLLSSPRKATAPTVTLQTTKVAPGESIRFTVARDPSALPTAVCVKLAGPTGQVRTCDWRTVLLTQQASGQGEIRLALSDSPGNYQLRVVDLLTGNGAPIEVQVTEPADVK